jgi:predicted AlkP superfamily pyrophosphatase or phosphodiesterase
VLAISVDGLNPQAVIELGPEGAPTFHELGREAAGTLNARTAYELSVTLPNHTSMLTGRPVDPDRGGHGVVVNDDLGGTVHEAAGERVVSVFDVVHDAGGSTALFTSKEKFAVFDRSWPVIDRYTADVDNADLVEVLVADLSERRTFTFLHLSAPDVAGHAHGWMSAPYLDAVREVDRLLGTLLDAVDRAPGGGSLAVVLTADHGGQGPGHGDPAVPADYTVPFFVRAPGVPGGTDLYDLNPQLRDPGTGRPAYDGPQPVRNGDLANLVTDLLGLPAVPGSALDAGQDLEVTRH